MVKHFRREEDFLPPRGEIAKNTFLTKIKVGLKNTASWPLPPPDFFRAEAFYWIVPWIENLNCCVWNLQIHNFVHFYKTP